MFAKKLIIGSFVSAAVASDPTGGSLSLTWTDCGDASTHTKITGVTPSSLTLGSTTTITGTGTLDEDVSDGTFEMKISGAGGVQLLDCKGDASTSKTCNLPLGTGTITFDGVTFPLKAGSQDIKVDLKLAAALPASLAKTTTQVTSVTGSGDKLFCLEVKTAPAGEANEDEYTQAFADFEKRFNRQYADDQERESRFNKFKATYMFIARENAKGTNTYELGVNEFSDLTPDEFAGKYFGFARPQKLWGNLTRLGTHEYNGETLASSVDWRQQGAVTPVKNQANCGSCWAFSTTGSLEGAWKLKTGNLVSLSEEQLVDCSKQNNGCQGGSMELAFKYVESNGICTETSYKYTAGGGRAGSCKASSCTTGIAKGGVTGYHDVARNSQQALMSAVAQQPVSIAVEADKSVFQSYRSGVMSGACGTNLDHGILAIGYGTSGGSDYWLVKNSWGASWGLSGYGMLERGKGGSGECGLLSQASYPSVSGGSLINI